MQKIEKLLVTAFLTTALSTSSLAFADEPLEGAPFDRSTITPDTFAATNVAQAKTHNKEFNDVRNDPLIGADGTMLERRDYIKDELREAAHGFNVHPNTAALNGLANDATLRESEYNRTMAAVAQQEARVIADALIRQQEAGVIADALRQQEAGVIDDTSLSNDISTGTNSSGSAVPPANHTDPEHIINAATDAAGEETIATERVVAAERTADELAEAARLASTNDGTTASAPDSASQDDKVENSRRRVDEAKAVEANAIEKADTARVIAELLTSINAHTVKTPEQVAIDAVDKYKEDKPKVVHLEKVLIEKHRRDTGDTSPALFDDSQSIDQLLDDALKVAYELVDEPYKSRNQTLDKKAQDLIKLSIPGYADNIKTAREQIKIEQDQARSLVAKELMATASHLATSSIALSNASYVEDYCTEVINDANADISSKNKARETREAVVREKEKLIEALRLQNVDTYQLSLDDNNKKAGKLGDGAKKQREIGKAPPPEKPILDKPKREFEESYPDLAKIMEAKNLVKSLSASQELAPEVKLTKLQAVIATSISTLRTDIRQGSNIRGSVSRFVISTRSLLGKD